MDYNAAVACTAIGVFVSGLSFGFLIGLYFGMRMNRGKTDA